ncbi:MAG: hypothetical protein ISS31_06140 [Kiritimatiellae bacterium]|nr:hypothetical protein [Kiritimatiellia bacterium]
MARYTRNFIEKSLEISRQLTILADQGEASCKDDGCAVLVGVIRDCAYKVRGRAEQEREVHRLRGQWELATAQAAE